MSALADRVALSRAAVEDSGPEINPSIQAMINCGKDTAGSCNGGSALGAWTWVKDEGGIPLDTCLGYAATNDMDCVDPANVCRNCMGKVEEPKGPDDYFCYGVDHDLGKGGELQMTPCFGDTCATHPYPTMRVREMGVVCNATYDASSEVHKANAVMMQLEIAARGPITCELDAGPMMAYAGGVSMGNGPRENRDHVVEVAGWGTEEDGTEYWEVREGTAGRKAERI